MRAGEGTADVTLVEFLLARIAEREKIAEAAAARVRRWPKDTRPPWVRARAFAQEERHAALEAFEGRETPDEVLAECQARRAIIEEFGRSSGMDYPLNIAYDEGLEMALTCLVQPFKDHPDFDAGWSQN